MRIALTIAFVSSLTLAGCGGSVGGSSYNPLNWFGKSNGETAEQPVANPLIPQRSALKRAPDEYQGQTVERLLDLSIEQTAGGAILNVKGLSKTLGAYNVRLVPAFESDVTSAPLPTLEYTLKALYSERSRPNAPNTSRELNAAVFISDDALLGVSEIRVNGAQNTLSVRR